MVAQNSTRKLRAVLYLRCSTAEQDDSIEQQRTWAGPFCQREGIDVLAEFADEARKGHDTGKRTDLHAMLEFCREQRRKRQPVEAIVCWHPNRFSRADSLETSWFLHEFRKAGVLLMISSQGRTDFSRMEDRLLHQIQQEAGSHKYSVDLAGACTRGKLAAALRGQWCGGPPPFGYRVRYRTVEVDGKRRLRPECLEPDPETAPILRWVFAEYATGEVGLRYLADRLNARGVPPPLHEFRAAAAARKGKPIPSPMWSSASVRKLLTNPRYLGSAVWNESTQGTFCCVVDMKIEPKAGARYRRNAAKDRVVIQGTHEALVDATTFNRVQDLLAQRRRRTTPKKGGGDFVLTGLLRCGHCGSPMVGRTAYSRNRRGPKVTMGRRYVCSGYWNYGKQKCAFNPIDEAPLLAAIGAKLRDKLLSPGTRKALMAALEEVLAAEGEQGPARVEDLQRRRGALQAGIDQAADRLLLEKDEALTAALRPRLKALVQERDSLDAELQTAKAHAPAAEDLRGQLQASLDAAEQLCELLPSAPAAEVRPHLRELVDYVELWWKHTDSKRSNGTETRCEFLRALLYPREGVLPVPVLQRAFRSR
jgi:DNA invertase Pin-like site-specific DNA recombinase